MAVTMQAVSGAGYPGVRVARHSRQCDPLHSNEEEKMEEETRNCWDTERSKVIPGDFAMSAQCNRVAVEDGHTESFSIRLKKKAQPRRNHRGLEWLPQRAPGR